jgi:hypothetical protein
MHTAATMVVTHTAKGVPMTKDGRWKMQFILRGPVLYGSARSKKKCQHCQDSEWDEAHKSAGDSDGHFSAGNFLS